MDRQLTSDFVPGADGNDVAVLYSEEHYVPNLFELTIRRTRGDGAVA